MEIMILYGSLVLSLLNIVNSLINYSQLMNEQSQHSAVDLYQLRTNTIINIKTLAQISAVWTALGGRGMILIVMASRDFRIMSILQMGIIRS